MANHLATYIDDHLAGAQFAISLLVDLQNQQADERLAHTAAEILIEVEADRTTLKDFATRLSDGGNTMKETAAWLSQKASRLKLTPDEKLGAFEAIELLCMGVFGKLALWNALKAIQSSDDRVAMLDLETLAARAVAQLSRLERLRLELASSVLGRRAEHSN